MSINIPHIIQKSLTYAFDMQLAPFQRAFDLLKLCFASPWTCIGIPNRPEANKMISSTCR